MELLNQIDDAILAFKYVAEFQETVKSDIGKLQNQFRSCVSTSTQIANRLDCISENQTYYERTWDFLMIKKKQEILLRRLQYIHEMLNNLKRCCAMNQCLLDVYDKGLEKTLLELNKTEVSTE